MSQAIFYVYILFRLNGIPCYVGKGKGDRWVRHEGRAKHKNKHLGSIIDQARAVGKELPKFKIVENVTEEEAFDLERLMIGLLGRGDDGPLVNLTDGGDGPSGYKPSPELIERQAAKRRGRKHTPEHCAKISAALKNKPRSPEAIAASAAGQRGKTKSFGWWSTEEGRAKQAQNNRGHTGHTHSEETIAVIKEARARQPRHVSPETQFKLGQEAWNKGLSISLNPATQFKPGHVMSPETCAKLSKSIKESWARRKAARQSSIDEGAQT